MIRIIFPVWLIQIRPPKQRRIDYAIYRNNTFPSPNSYDPVALFHDIVNFGEHFRFLHKTGIFIHTLHPAASNRHRINNDKRNGNENKKDRWKIWKFPDTDVPFNKRGR